MHGQKLKTFKRPKNRKDGSDFDDSRTKKIAASCFMKKNQTNETKEKFLKNSKNYRKKIEKFSK